MGRQQLRCTARGWIAAFLLALAPGAQAACNVDVTAMRPIQAERDRSDYVLTAFVTNAHVVPDEGDPDSFAGIVYTVEPLHVVKGDVPKALSVYSENSSGRFVMDVGGTYVLFANRRAGGDVVVDGCGHSGEVTGRYRVMQLLGLVNPGAPERHSPPGTDWKAAWEFVLAARHDDISKCNLHVMLRNKGETPLDAVNLTYTLSNADGMYGWAIDDTLRSERIRLDPGEITTRTTDLRALRFHDLRGNDVAWETVAQALRSGTWRISASMVDMGLPKPTTLASYLVVSNRVTLDGIGVARCSRKLPASR